MTYRCGGQVRDDGGQGHGLQAGALGRRLRSLGGSSHRRSRGGVLSMCRWISSDVSRWDFEGVACDGGAEAAGSHPHPIITMAGVVGYWSRWKGSKASFDRPILRSRRLGEQVVLHSDRRSGQILFAGAGWGRRWAVDWLARSLEPAVLIDGGIPTNGRSPRRFGRPRRRSSAPAAA